MQTSYFNNSAFNNNAGVFNGLSNDDIVIKAPAAGAFEPIGKASNKYSFVPTLEVVDLIRSAGWVPVKASQSNALKGSTEGFQRHVIRFAMPGELITELGEERVELVLYNSHDTGSAFRLIAGIFRLVCSNGMVVGNQKFQFTHKHIGFSRQALTDSAYRIADGAGLLTRGINRWKAIELTPDERGVYAQAAHQLLDTPVPSHKLLNARRREDRRNDLWTVSNVVQENIIKGGQSTYGQKKNGKYGVTSMRPVKALDRDLKLNQALWTLTEKMAELKNAEPIAA